MRAKTDDRRRAIVEAAGEVFRRSGFDRASMAAISAAVGGSKTTLYGYFNSKEDLYSAVMMEAVERQVENFLEILDRPSGDLPRTLTDFGMSYVSLMLSEDVVAVVRSGLAGREAGGLGRVLFERGPKRCWDQVAIFLEREMTGGRLRPAPPTVAAVHLKGLLQAGLFEPYLFGAPPLVSSDAAVADAVDAFLRAYGPVGVPSPRAR